jgi:hypothetical protein
MVTDQSRHNLAVIHAGANLVRRALPRAPQLGDAGGAANLELVESVEFAERGGEVRSAIESTQDGRGRSRGSSWRPSRPATRGRQPDRYSIGWNR